MKKTFKLKKKKKLIIISAVVIVALVGGTIFFVNAKKRSAMAAIAETMTAQETQATIGTISNTIVGTGTLEGDVTESITVPSGIVIEEVMVESGDHVEAGDVLATVDKASILSAMETVQEEIEALDEEINESVDDTDEQTIESSVDGRVKKIYIETGSDAADCMIENGALMLVSIDGYMAVDIDGVTGVAEDDDVTVVLADGSKKDGSIETISGGKATIIFTDNGAEIGEKVTVKTEDGTSLGSGEAYIHQQLAITATGGTVDSISVSENESISSGTDLCTLNSDEHTVEYQQQIAERESLTESLQKLIAISKSGAITAETSGTISSVNVSSSSSTSSSSSSSNNAYGMSNMSYQSGASVSNSTQTVASMVRLSATNEDIVVDDETSDDTNQNEDTTQEEQQNTQLMFAIIGSGDSTQTGMVIATPATGATPQSAITATDGTYTGSISWTPTAAAFAADTCYQASVTVEAGDGYVFGLDSIQKIESGILSGVTVSEDQKTMSFVITFPYTKAVENNACDNTGNNAGTNNTTSNTVNNTTGTTVNGVTGNASGNSTTTGSVTGGNAANTNVSGGSAASAAGGSASGGSASAVSASSTGDSSDTSSSSSSSSSSSEITAFTLASDDTMVLSVSVDELDINSVSKEQEATITLDALENQTFTGTVTNVSNSAGSSSGGVSKYTVKITIPKDEKMKEGMNASATIIIEQKENVVTIPVNALQERGQEVFVYTEKDDEGNLSGEVSVTTGLSDGDNVEITEGLSEGDTVYYQKVGSSSSDSSGFSMPGGMGDFSGGGGMPDMGEMPSGGSMPSGGGGMPSGGGGGMPSRGE